MAENAAPQTQFVRQLTGAQSALYGCIRTLMAGAPEAADVLQETNCVLWQNAAEYDATRPFLPWAYRIAHFQVMAYRKRRSRERLVFDDDLVAQLAEEFSMQSSAGDRALRAMERCLQKLLDAHCKLVAAKYEHGDSINQIAERAGKPVNEPPRSAPQTSAPTSPATAAMGFGSAMSPRPATTPKRRQAAAHVWCNWAWAALELPARITNARDPRACILAAFSRCSAMAACIG